jgi:hypothetical protein
VIVNLIGSILTFSKNIKYYFDSRNGRACRIINHSGDPDKLNWSDNLDFTIRFLIGLISFYLPYILTLILFSRQTKKNENVS